MSADYEDGEFQDDGKFYGACGASLASVVGCQDESRTGLVSAKTIHSNEVVDSSKPIEEIPGPWSYFSLSIMSSPYPSVLNNDAALLPIRTKCSQSETCGNLRL